MERVMEQAHPSHGLITTSSVGTVAEVTERIKRFLPARGVRIFAHIDFRADAMAESLELDPIQLLIVGNPRAGTPMIAARPQAAIDLPLKILVWANNTAGVKIAHNDPIYLRERHDIPIELLPKIAGLSALISQALAEA